MNDIAKYHLLNFAWINCGSPYRLPNYNSAEFRRRNVLESSAVSANRCASSGQNYYILRTCHKHATLVLSATTDSEELLNFVLPRPKIYALRAVHQIYANEGQLVCKKALEVAGWNGYGRMPSF
jgi:hypothetical protein